MKKMMKKTKRVAALALACVLSLSFAGCGGETEAGKTAKTDMDLSSYPIQTDATLTYWMEITANISATASNMGETEFAKGLAERTGVKVDYIHPAVGQAKEAFNLLVASGDLPDIIEHFWLNAMPGAPETALSNNVIIPLNDLMEEYAPNLSKYLAENPDADRAVKTDSGKYFVFPSLKNDDKLHRTTGAVIRKDWLDELGLSVPETLEDWENMLKAFRDEKNISAPLTLRSNNVGLLYSLVGFSDGFYLENGKVSHGIFDKNYRRGLEVLNRWYNEGLLDKNYSLLDNSMLNSKMLNGEAGATFAAGGSHIGTWMKAKAGTGFDIVGVKLPKINGEDNKYGGGKALFNGYNSAGISTSCKTPELAAKYLDYLYSEEGHLYANFGTEGVSYTMVDDYPTYTDLLMDNPEGLSVSQAMSKYIRGNSGGPYIQDGRYLEQYYELPQQKEALIAWQDQIKYSAGTVLPQTAMTIEESSEYGTIYTDISKYCSENVVRFISGEKSFDEFDAFVAQVEKMGIKRAIEIQQAAYDRYMNRK